MSLRLHTLRKIPFTFFIGILATVSVTAQQEHIKFNFAGIDAWLDCEQKATDVLAPSCYRASAQTDGGKLAELAIPSFGAVPDKHTDDAPIAKVAALTAALRGLPIKDLDMAAAALFPPQNGTVRIYVVGNGIPVWGDMYERNFAHLPGHPQLDDAGEPVILINARLAAALYSGDAVEQKTTASQVLRHELFHIHYAWFRLQDPRWRAIASTMNVDRQLLLLVQDEGIAHFLASREEWHSKGFPKERGEKALADLAQAVAEIHAGKPSGAILQRANEGSYWEKFGAISGALFAYGVEKHEGAAGLKTSLHEGPPSLLLQYDRAARQDVTLPPLPASLLNWAEKNRTMLSAATTLP
jgi:hypothetical protein